MFYLDIVWVLLSRRAVQLRGELYDGFLISGTGGNPGLLGAIGHKVATIEMKLRGAKTKSPMLNFYLSETSIRTLSQIVQNLIGYLQIIIKLINILRIRYVVSFVRRVFTENYFLVY